MQKFRKWLAKVFHRQPVATVLADQLYEAERLHAEHMAAAEMHVALAGVYGARIQRIQKAQPPTGLRAVQ